MEPFNFNELPEVVRRLFEKVEHIENMLFNLETKDEGENDILTIEEAAHFLKVSVQALYNRVSRNEIPVSKPGKRLYFRKSELQEWINGGKKTTLRQISSNPDSRFKKYDK